MPEYRRQTRCRWQLNQIDCMIEGLTSGYRKHRLIAVYKRLLSIYENGRDSVSKPTYKRGGK